mmetsp:Transcript_12029/g.41739  ORF Transcript_12029/g.41739 Transcript_12029/m.41739 type:complete len:213 (-) Transcript_12029:1890-2528(-)
MRRLTGMEASVSLKRRGFFPRGGGEITLTVSPKERLAAFRMLERGDVVELQGIVLGSEQTLKELQSSLLQTLREEPALGNLSLQLSQEVIAASVSSAAVVIWAKTEGGCVLGASALSEKRVNPHQLAGQAVESLRESLSHGGCVDEHMQDQLMIFMALGDGRSSLRTGPLSLHTKTAMAFLEEMTGVKFEVREEGTSVIIECQGLGYRHRQD